jgi:EAL domain-containing protein (putative c-di-GMP-specific phosphodiesterase class I)
MRLWQDEYHGGDKMDDTRRLASHANLQIRRLEKELEETADKAKKNEIEKEIERLRSSIS